jgi:hypothetical protein
MIVLAQCKSKDFVPCVLLVLEFEFAQSETLSKVRRAKPNAFFVAQASLRCYLHRPKSLASPREDDVFHPSRYRWSIERLINKYGERDELCVPDWQFMSDNLAIGVS